MERISNKSLIASVILKFGLPVNRIDYEAIRNWLYRKFDEKMEERDMVENIAEEMHFDIKTVRELTKEEIEYLENLQSVDLKEKLDSITVEEHILRQFVEPCMYCGELDKYTKVQLEAIKRMVEKGLVVIETRKDKYVGEYKMVVPTIKGQVIGTKVYYQPDISDFRKRIERVGIDSSIIDDQYIEYALLKNHGVVYDDVLYEYCKEKGIEISEGTTFSVGHQEMPETKEARTEDEENVLNSLLATNEENISICLIEPRYFDFDFYGMEFKIFNKWDSVNDKKNKKIFSSQKQYSNVAPQDIIEDLLRSGTYNIQTVIETKMVNGEPTYKARGYIIRKKEGIKIGFNPLYLAELKKDQSLKLK